MQRLRLYLPQPKICYYHDDNVYSKSDNGGSQDCCHTCVLTTLTHHTMFQLISGKNLYSYDNLL